MDYTFLILLALILILLYIVFRQRDAISYLRSRIDEINSSIPNWIDGAVAKSFQNSAAVFESVFSSAISKNTEVIKGAFATSLKELGIQEDLGKLSQASSELKNITSDLKTMFQIKHARAKFGELQLENLLRDIFPASRLVFQKNIGYGIPDACVMVEDSKYLCIDSKFPLENFRRYSEAESEEERSRYWREFLKDVQKHAADIRQKYVGKENTLDFALMFVPSDTIYYHIISESPEVAVEASKSGVILASPSVLPAYLNLISARIQAAEISRRAEEIQRKLAGMGGHIDELESNLNTLIRHIQNAYNKTSDVKASLSNLKGYHASICNVEVEE